MLRVGLTGGIASGKSTVANLFAELGANTIDTDMVAREMVAPGMPGLAMVVSTFGAHIISESGELDRQALRTIVFSDSEQRRKLEAILHPLIRAQALEQLKQLKQSKEPYALVIVPLLLETDFEALVDRIAVVDCSRETQMRRLLARDDISVAEAEAILDAQVTREARLARADDVIDNEGNLESTRNRVEALHTVYALGQAGYRKQ
jgi:dephospho-CoA kinase